MIRKLICFVAASAMSGFGLYVMFNTIIVEHAFSRFVLMGFFLAGLGGYWLWLDFIGPLLRRN